MSVRRVLGVVVMLGGFAVFGWGLVHLIQTGTCASGNTPFEIARPCPEGTGGKILATTVGILVALIGGAVAGLALLLAPLSFVAVGASSIAAALVGDNTAEGLFPWVFGGGFLVMGLLPLLAYTFLRGWGKGVGGAGGGGSAGRTRVATPLYRRGFSRPRGASAPPPAPPTPTPHHAPAADDPVPAPLARLAELERLAELRRSGAITSAEFERLKAEILSQ